MCDGKPLEGSEQRLHVSRGLTGFLWPLWRMAQKHNYSYFSGCAVPGRMIAWLVLTLVSCQTASLSKGRWIILISRHGTVLQRLHAMGWMMFTQDPSVLTMPICIFKALRNLECVRLQSLPSLSYHGLSFLCALVQNKLGSNRSPWLLGHWTLS